MTDFGFDSSTYKYYATFNPIAPVTASYSNALTTHLNGMVLAKCDLVFRVDNTLSSQSQLRLARLIGAPTTKVTTTFDNGDVGSYYEAQFIMS